MSKRLRQMRNRILLVSTVWFAVAFYFALIQIPSDDLLNKESPQVMSRMEDECTGSYQQRYDCKNSIAIDVSNHTLYQVTLRIAITVLGPCFGLWYYLELRRREPKPILAKKHVDGEPAVHDDLSWKNAARTHVSQAPKPEDEDSPQPPGLHQ